MLTNRGRSVDFEITRGTLAHTFAAEGIEIKSGTGFTGQTVVVLIPCAGKTIGKTRRTNWVSGISSVRVEFIGTSCGSDAGSEMKEGSGHAR